MCDCVELYLPPLPLWMWSWLLTCIKYQSVESVECYLHSSLCTTMTWCLDIGMLFTCTFTSILQDHKRPENNRVGRMLSWNAEPYHAGLSAARRKQVQKAFMSGKSWTFNCFTSIYFAAGLTPRAAIFFLSMLVLCSVLKEGISNDQYVSVEPWKIVTCAV